MYGILVSNTYLTLAVGVADADKQTSGLKKFFTKPLKRPYPGTRVGPHLRKQPARTTSSQQSSKQVLKKIIPKSVRHDGVDE